IPEPTVTPMPTEIPEPTVTPVPGATETPEPKDETKEDENQEDIEQPSNEPAYTIDIPAHVMLNESKSFIVRTIPSANAEGGNMVVTIQGTESRDRQNFALYCGNSCWEYKLHMDNAEITPLQNSVVFSSGETERQVDVISIPGSNLCAGLYSGTLTFSIAYEPNLR
ncbi:MAG: hypothetical protein Q4D16_19055, partial [Eubacteriales bacterium]|nr:hypothetical protein [Eubacteriales bacterium]